MDIMQMLDPIFLEIGRVVVFTYIVNKLSK